MFVRIGHPNLNFGWLGKDPFAPSSPLSASNQAATLELPPPWERWAFNQSMALRLRQQEQQQQSHQQTFQMVGDDPFAPRSPFAMEFKHGGDQEPSTPHASGQSGGFDDVKGEPNCWVCPSCFAPHSLFSV